MTKVDICVVTHNSLNDIQKLLNILHSDNDGKSWELFIQDNGSTDGTKEWLMDNSVNMNISYLSVGSNDGYAVACNNLAAMGSSPFIALCNADIWLQTSDIHGMINSFHETGADILGPKQRDKQGRITHGGIFGTNTKPKFRGWKERDTKDILYRDRVDAVTVSGAAYFIRRDTWDDLTYNSQYQNLYPGASGAFLPTEFYYEETWCSYFARHLGYRVMYDGSVSIGHQWHNSHEVGDYLDTRVVHESQALFRKTCDAMGIEHD